MCEWYRTGQAHELPSPALLVYPERIADNILRMIAMAGGTNNLRPHVKTHKMAEIVKMQRSRGITKFKCATLREAEMLARCGAEDVMLAMQPVGPHLSGFFALRQHYPNTRFSAITDNLEVIAQFESRSGLTEKAELWLDINNGMNRTGIQPGGPALHLCQYINKSKRLVFRGLHVYDGHIHQRDRTERKNETEAAFAPVQALIANMIKARLPDPVVVAGGTPTFPFHAGRHNTETSPGTCLLWDYGYKTQFPDLDFLEAAVVITRLVSKPQPNLLCLDLGHKAIAAEMPHPRVHLQGLPVNRFCGHNEEHLIVESDEAEKYKPGDLFYGIPWHICPTVPRYPLAYTIEDGRITGEWVVDARDRKTTFSY